MFCRNCGKEIREGAAFCIGCGTPVAAATTPVAPVEPVAPAAKAVEEPVVETPVVEEIKVEDIKVEEIKVEDIIAEDIKVEEPVVEEKVVEPTPVQQATQNTQQATQNVQQTAQQAKKAPVYQAPALKLPAERAMWKMIVFGILTCGIYPIVIYAKMADELNMAASRYDGERTTNYYVATMLTACTFGIYGIYWMHAISKRIGFEVKRRGYDYKFGAGTFWGWNVLGSLIIVGPFIYLHKLCKAMNMINESYNYYG